MQNFVIARFGGQDREFKLTVTAIARLEGRMNSGIGAIYSRLASQQWFQDDIWETIRFGLQGSGMDEPSAINTVSAVKDADDATIGPYVQLAADIISAHLNAMDQAALAMERMEMDGKKSPGEGDLVLPPQMTKDRQARWDSGSAQRGG